MVPVNELLYRNKPVTLDSWETVLGIVPFKQLLNISNSAKLLRVSRLLGIDPVR